MRTTSKSHIHGIPGKKPSHPSLPDGFSPGVSCITFSFPPIFFATDITFCFKLSQKNIPPPPPHTVRFSYSGNVFTLWFEGKGGRVEYTKTTENKRAPAKHYSPVYGTDLIAFGALIPFIQHPARDPSIVIY